MSHAPARSVKFEGRELTIQKLVAGGQGFGRLDDGRIVMLGDTLPGDRIALHEAQPKRGFFVATRWTLLAPSPARIASPCVYAERCGGCDLIHLGPDDQAQIKLDIVREALTRVGGLAALGDQLELIRVGEPLAYRQRVRLQCSPQGALGFFGKASHALVPIDDCVVAKGPLREALGKLTHDAQAHPGAWTPFSEVELGIGTELKAKPWLTFTPRPLSERLGAPRGAAPLPLYTRRHGRLSLSPARQEGWNALRTRLEQEFTVHLAGEPAPLVRYDLPFSSFMLAPVGSFTQVNWAVNQRLIEDIAEGARQRRLKSFADLYCGAGNFTLPLLRRGLAGVGVESSEQAIAAAQRAAALQELPTDSFLHSDVDPLLRAWAKQERRFDLVLCDPPRAGLSSTLQALTSVTRRYLALCSCNPVTWARDLSKLLQLGFKVQQIAVYDMFPQTHHVETLAWLKAK